MVFSSHVFIFFFLPACLLLYYATPRRFKSLALAVASFVFYGCWRPDFTLLILFSSVVDYTAGMRIARAHALGKRGRPWLLFSVITNLGLLGYFKYANFGVDTLNAILEANGAEPLSWTRVILPVGISFYTFQTMSYTIDLYRGHVKPARNFVDFLCYVSMFPQLVAGPIVRYITVEKQLRGRKHTFAKFFQGVLAFEIGLAKKILIADVVAGMADQAFSSTHMGVLDAWLGVSAYAFQIYFDFSGYSDMAIGLGLMFGFRFPINFNRPYISKSITEFWRRWHISLSTWLRDYLYISLGGNRKGRLRTYFNLAATMFLGGLWHGAAWTFVAWGVYQGTWLIAERLFGKRSFYGWAPQPLRIAFTFAIVLVGWVFFRATDLPAAFAYLGSMFDASGLFAGLSAVDLRPMNLTALLVAAALIWFAPTTQRIVERAHPLMTVFAQAIFVLSIMHMFHNEHIPFLYFQF